MHTIFYLLNLERVIFNVGTTNLIDYNFQLHLLNNLLMQTALKFFLSFLLLLFIGTGVCQEKLGLQAPNFEGKTIKDKEIKLSDYAGKVVLIDFWASWCPPCREEMPRLIDFYRSHKNPNFELIAVNIDNKKENMEHFLDDLFPEPAFPIVIDNNQKIPSLFNIEAMPTTIFIDKKGKIRFWHNGFKKSYVNDFNSELTQLLKEN
jgi:thiol-disulfide isomerase/thioredoxin